MSLRDLPFTTSNISDAGLMERSGVVTWPGISRHVWKDPNHERQAPPRRHDLVLNTAVVVDVDARTKTESPLRARHNSSRPAARVCTRQRIGDATHHRGPKVVVRITHCYAESTADQAILIYLPPDLFSVSKRGNAKERPGVEQSETLVDSEGIYPFHPDAAIVEALVRGIQGHASREDGVVPGDRMPFKMRACSRAAGQAITREIWKDRRPVRLPQ